MFVICLQRVNAIVLALGLNLLLSAAFLRSPLSLPAGFVPVSPSLSPSPSPPGTGMGMGMGRNIGRDIGIGIGMGMDMDGMDHIPLLVTLPIIVIVHTSLSSLYSPSVLPRIGVHTASYVGLLVSLMCFFAGLAVWNALS